MTRPEPQGAPADARLIEAWRSGDEAAASELVRRHARALARFLGAAGGAEDVDDLVQETFFRAFRRIDSFRGEASFRGWLFAIGANALKDLRRHRTRHPVLPLENREIVDERSDPGGEARERDLRAQLEAGVRRLPPMQRDVFLLRAQQGMEYEEIARVLETSPGAARVHYHHAVKRLKQLIR